MTSVLDISWSDPPGVMVVVGDDEARRREAKEAIIRRLGGSHEVRRHRGSNWDEDRFRQDVAGHSFLANDRLVLVEAMDQLEPDQLEPLQTRSDDVCAVLLGTSHPWASDDALSAQVDYVRRVSSPDPWDIPDWIHDRCRQAGYAMDPSLCETFHLNVGDDLQDIRQELEKLFRYLDAHDRARAESEDVQAVLYQHSEMDPFDIFEQWGHQRHHRAVQLFRAHCRQVTSDPSLKLIGIGDHHLKRLIRIRSMMDQHMSTTEIQSRLELSSYLFRTTLQPQAKTRTLQTWMDAYRALTSIAYRIKTGMRDGTMMLEHFLWAY